MSNPAYPYMIGGPNLPESDKNDDWRKAAVNYYCNVSNQFYEDWERMRENYALKNNQLNKEEYQQMCKTMGTDHTDLFINAYNKTPTIIDALKGEELARPFSFTVVNESPEIANRIEREIRLELEKLQRKIFELELKKAEELSKLELDDLSNKAKGNKNIDIQTLSTKIKEKYDKIFGSLQNPKDILDLYTNMNTIEETTMNKIMKYLVSRKHIKYLKNESFEHVLLAGCEFIELFIQNAGDFPSLKIINPLAVFYQKSPDVKFIHQSDYAGYLQSLTLQKVLETWGHKLNEEALDKLCGFGVRNGVRGLDASLFNGPKNPALSPWKRSEQENLIGRSRSGDYYSMEDPRYGGESGYSFFGLSYFQHYGLSMTEQSSRLGSAINVYTVYWKSNRKLGKLKFINDYGEQDETLVDEDFVIPNKAKRIVTRKANLNADLIEYVWIDTYGNNKSLEWIWVPEVWRGIRLGTDIFVDVEPVEHAYQSLLNPYETKLPLFGYIYNNVNAYSVSPMDRMKPYQKLYYGIMSKFVKLISQDKGNMLFVNTLLMDKEFGTKKTMRIAEDQGYVFYNPLSNSKGFNGINNMKIAENLNMSTIPQLKEYIVILQDLEKNIQLAAGMSDQRIAQTDARMTATDNYRDTMNSINMSEPMMVAHDLLWEEILQAMMEMTCSVLADNKGVIRTLLNDEELAIIDLQKISLVDNFRLKVGDNSKSFKILEQFKQLSQALIQNEQASLSTLIDLMRKDSLSEFQKELKQLEKDREAKMEEAQKAQQEHEKEMLQMQLKSQEDMQVQQLDNTYLKEYMTYQREDMKAKYNNMAFDIEKDYNKDGIADYLQIEQQQQKIDNESRKIDLSERELNQKEMQLAKDNQDKAVDRSHEIVENAKERAMKQKIEQMKNKAKQMKTK